jgi:hypothetical protein
VTGAVRLSLAGLPPGDYELRAVIEDRRAGTTAEQVVDFAVEYALPATENRPGAWPE